MAAVPSHHTVVPPQFDVSVEPSRHHITVAVAGEVDMATVEDVQHALDELVASGFEDVVLDLRNTSFIDSCGLRLIFSHARRAADRGHRFRVVAGGEPVAQLLDVTGVAHAVEILDRPPR